MLTGRTECTFIDDEKIRGALEEGGARYSPAAVRDVLAKARELQGLELEELAALLWVEDLALEEEIYAVARKIKETIYGKRLVFFALCM